MGRKSQIACSRSRPHHPPARRLGTLPRWLLEPRKPIRRSRMPAILIHVSADALAQPAVKEAVRRDIIATDERRVRYSLSREQTYNWDDPEEWVRATTVAWLIVEKGYPANRIRLEVVVPRRTPSDFADIVVYEDDSCRVPYLVVENKASGQSARDRDQGIEQAFGEFEFLAGASHSI